MLVVDDEPIVGQAFAKVLNREHEVTVRTDPREALEALAQGESFDIIFCDVAMPTMTGPGFHAELERLAPALASRIVFVTGSASEATCLLFGTVPNMVLSKPFEARVIREIAREFVEAGQDVGAVTDDDGARRLADTPR